MSSVTGKKPTNKGDFAMRVTALGHVIVFRLVTQPTDQS